MPDTFLPAELETRACPAPWTGHRHLRREDAALLQGRGCFVGDVRLPGCLHVAFVRGAQPGRIARLDVTQARQGQGVRAVVTAADLDLTGHAAVNKLVSSLDPAPLEVLAAGQIHATGQPVVAVVAEQACQAADAAETVMVDIEAGGTAPGGAFAETWAGPGLPEGAVTVGVEVTHARVAASPMEPRGAAARWADGRLTVWLGTQTPHRAHADLACMLGLPPSQIRVVAPDVGGAFGGKASIYPEDVLVAWAAWRLGTAVRWRGSRAEDLLAGTHGRGLSCRGTLAVAPDGRMLGLRARVSAPLGHWMPFSAVVPGRNAGRILPGPYAVQAVDVAVAGHATRHAAMGIYRGAGRPEAAMLMERLADEAARAVGLDPVELRRRNLVPRSALPLRRPTGEVLDSGDLAALLDRAVAVSGYAARRRALPGRRAAGDLVGLGIGLYVEPCGAGWESARLRLCPDGSFVAATGSTAQGQGRETAFAQILADALYTVPSQVTVRHGDTAATPPGIGALASRSTAIGGSALLVAARALIGAASPVAARLLGWNDPAALCLGADGFMAPGGVIAASWRDVAAACPVPIVVEERFETPGEAWSSGCCIAAVRIDPETMEPAVEHLTLVDDAGTVVNPVLVEGQLLGGIAQGLGEALMERIVYDADGQLLTGSLMDYALPRAADMPPVALASAPCPTPLNPLGAKGVGEAGCIGVPAAVVNAAVDALAGFGVRHLDMPLSAGRIWHAVRDAIQTKEDAA